MIINDDFRNHLDKFDGNSYVISDPPYNQGYHYSEYSDELNIDEYGQILQDAFGGQQSVIISYPYDMPKSKVCKKCNGERVIFIKTNETPPHPPLYPLLSDNVRRAY